MTPLVVALLAEAAAHRALADAKEAQAAALQVVEPAAPVVREPDALVSGAELDRLLSISSATRNRLAREGLPFVHVGSRRRYRPSECRSWLAARGKRPTTPAPREADDDPIDVSGALAKAGMRPVRSPAHCT